MSSSALPRYRQDTTMTAEPSSTAPALANPTAHDDDLFDEELPEASQNRIAMAIGAYMQRVIGIVVLVTLTMLVLITSLMEYGTNGDLDYQISAIALLVAAVLQLLMIWVIINSPYDMLVVLRATIGHMQAVGTKMKANNKEMEVNNEEMASQLTDLQSQLMGLQNQLNIAAAQLQERNDQINEQQMINADLEKVSTGLQGTLTQLMKAGHGQLKGLEKLADNFGEHISAAIRGEKTALLDTLTGLDEQTEKARVAAETTTVLVRQVENLTKRLEDLLEDMQDEAFDSTIEDLVHMVDEYADRGIRAKLQKNEMLNANECATLFKILSKINDELENQYDVNKEKHRKLRTSISGEIERTRSIVHRADQKFVEKMEVDNVDNCDRVESFV